MSHTELIPQSNYRFNNRNWGKYICCRITADHSAAATLGKEARRWSTRIAREVTSIKENNRKVQVLLQLKESGQKVNALGD